MNLLNYIFRRDFGKSIAPDDNLGKHTGRLMFVIQKHHASQLHYDFRLEMDGVLKSWAIPKGPSTNPKNKRFAVRVEDHPFAYRRFEGIIPQGEYGAGAVIVWDEGYYEPLPRVKGKREQEKEALRQLITGVLKFKLYGKKLNGEYELIKTEGIGKNSWLLVKHNDEYASVKDITKLSTSVLSGKTIEKIESEIGIAS